ncbi:hypothetical protein JHD50_04515 [Sulfurimonas sp. MAG313]|nr:hypothetical protein [Sulfurimonas sp. MAG313]MDF1880570.1 hypothetical protein [Sulfurimonas sp. MAG313]
MKVTHFFIFLFIFSISLFVLLKPTANIQKIQGNIAQLEIEDFTLYKMDKTGVLSVVSGSMGRQYIDHYEIQNVHYIENKNQVGEHLYSDNGVFKGNIAYLDTNVRYFKEDGLSFESNHAIYNTKNSYLYIPDSFTLTQNQNVVYGHELHYDSVSGQIKAEKINANYDIEEKK